MRERWYSGHKIDLLTVGAGNIGGAIVKRLVESSFFTPNQIGVFHADKEREQFLSDRLGVCTASPKMLTEDTWVLIAVKPCVLNQLDSFFRSMPTNVSYLSVVAGASLEQLEQVINSVRLVRAMPNLALKFGLSPTAVEFHPELDLKNKDFARRLLQCLGSVYEISSTDFPAFCTLSSASPAFAVRFFTALRDACVNQGIQRVTTDRILLEIVKALPMLLNEMSLEHIISSIATPGGITAAGLDKLEGLDRTVSHAVIAAAERAVKLEQGFL